MRIWEAIEEIHKDHTKIFYKEDEKEYQIRYQTSGAIYFFNNNKVLPTQVITNDDLKTNWIEKKKKETITKEKAIALLLNEYHEQMLIQSTSDLEDELATQCHLYVNVKR